MMLYFKNHYDLIAPVKTWLKFHEYTARLLYILHCVMRRNYEAVECKKATIECIIFHIVYARFEMLYRRLQNIAFLSS